MAAGWVPYRDGHWAWIDPWGWTWVDDAPWGFAVSHYGRWASFGGTWGWIPGPTRGRVYYAPALVAFVGGSGGGVGWFPLAPREAYRPAYPVSRGYFENINRSNTVINNTIINNAYSQTNVTNVVYANRRVAGAVVAVPSTAFVQSQPVSRAGQRVSRDMIAGTPVLAAPPVAPSEKSVHGPAGRGDKPPSRAFERPVIARGAPPAAHAGFEAQREQLSAQPGKPLDPAARRELKPAASAPVPLVKVVSPPQEAPRTLQSPPAAPGGRTGDAREKPAAQKRLDAPAVQATPEAAPRGAMPSRVTPPIPAAQAPEQRGRPESRGNAEARGQPAAPPPPPRAAEPQPAPRQAAPPPEQRSRPEPRGNDEQRRNAEARGSAVAPPGRGAAEPRAVPPPPPQAAPPAPAPRATQPGPDAGRQNERRNEGGEQRHNEENRRQER